MTTPPGAGHFSRRLAAVRAMNDDAVHHRHQLVVVPRDGAFGKEHQRPLAVDQDVDGRVDRLPVDALAVDAERADAPEHEASSAGSA